VNTGVYPGFARRYTLAGDLRARAPGGGLVGEPHEADTSLLSFFIYKTGAKN